MATRIAAFFLFLMLGGAFLFTGAYHLMAKGVIYRQERLKGWRMWFFSVFQLFVGLLLCLLGMGFWPLGS